MFGLLLRIEGLTCVGPAHHSPVALGEKGEGGKAAEANRQQRATCVTDGGRRLQRPLAGNDRTGRTAAAATTELAGTGGPSAERAGRSGGPGDGLGPGDVLGGT